MRFASLFDVKKPFTIEFSLVIALRPQTPEHIRGGWSHYTDTSEPVDGNGATKKLSLSIQISNQGPFDHKPNALTTCANRAHKFTIL
jgi:hypothetical protein